LSFGGALTGYEFSRFMRCPQVMDIEIHCLIKLRLQCGTELQP
jgi:hypothetical protein